MTQTLPSRPVLIFRSFVFWVVFMLSTLVLCFPVILSSFVSVNASTRMVRLWVQLNLITLRVVCKLNYRVEGFDTVPKEPSIFFAKHQSTWETLFLQYLMPGVLYVAKKELAYIPFFGWAMSSLNYVLIDRSSGRLAINQMVEQYRDRKAKGLSLVIFPEGTRREVGAEPNYKIGGAVVAAETNTGVVPVAVNAGEFWPRHSFIKWPGEITMAFGPVIHPAGKSPDKIREAAQTWIETKMTEITVVDRFPY